MEKWDAQIISRLEEKLKDVKERDIRFFRIDEFKRNIRRTETFSKSCPFCQSQKINITEVVDKTDIAINTPGQPRREYDRLIGRINSHMQKQHGFYTPFYFTYLFAFFGMVGGIVIGYFLLKLFPLHGWALLSLGFVGGLATGYVIGGIKDNKIRSSKKLM